MRRHLMFMSLPLCFLISLLALQACASTSEGSSEARTISHKQRWYWLGSSSLQDHHRPEDPRNYWLEVDGENVVLQADCNHASAQAISTVGGRLWIKGIATTRMACPNGRTESLFLRQIGRINAAEQRSTVLKASLEQYGEAMFFSLDPEDKFDPYLCEGGENLAQITHKRGISIWKGEEYSEYKNTHKSEEEPVFPAGCKPVQIK